MRQPVLRKFRSKDVTGIEPGYRPGRIRPAGGGDLRPDDTEPRIGTSLLDGHELDLRFVDDGDVSMEAL